MELETSSHFYDHAFSEIFSHVPFVESLFRDILDEKWVDLIDFSTMDVKRSVFKGIRQYKRESDLLLHFGLKDNRDVFVYSLMEFQRTPEEMRLRVFEYLALLYIKISRNQKEKGKLPVVIPLVIFNGDKPYPHGTHFEDLFDIPHPSLLDYVPHFQFLLVDISSIPEEKLTALKSAIAYFLRMEKTDLTQTEQAIEDIISILKEIEEQKEIFSTLATYIQALFEYKELPTEKLNQYIDDNKGGGSMLMASMERIKQTCRNEGYDEGYDEGKNEGYDEGKNDGYDEGKKEEKILMLLKILHKRFGSVPQALEDKIQAVDDTEKLDAVSDVALDASSLAPIEAMLSDGWKV